MNNQTQKDADRVDGNSLRLVYKLYLALAQEFSIECSTCNELQGGQADTTESLASAQAWLAALDDRIAVHQLRQFLQTSSLADEASLRAALAYYLHQSKHGDSHRDKTDFLLVQLFSICAPSLLEDGEVTFGYVAGALEPVLGSKDLKPLDNLQGLDAIVKTASACHTLQELFASGVIEKGRELKLAAADDYFAPAALVSFTRFNFLLRRCFFRSMHRDLNAILDGLRTLELRGVENLDCRGAELSGEEPVSRLRMICQSWKAMFQAEYSFGQPLRMLVDLRAAVDAVLAKGSEQTGKQPGKEPGKEAGKESNPAVAGEPDQPAQAMAAAATGETGKSKRRGFRPIKNNPRSAENSGSKKS
jgi:hypothetical protein